MYDFPPEPGGLQHIGLVHTHHLLPALPGGGQGGAGDPLDFHNGVTLRVICLRAESAGPSAALAEVDAAGEFAHDQQIETVGNQIGPEQALVGQRRVELCRAQIGVKPHCLANTEQTSFRPDVGRESIPLRPAYRPEQDGVGCKAAIDRLPRQRGAGSVDCRPTEQIFRKAELKSAEVGRPHQNGNGAFNDLGADPVPLQQSDFVFHLFLSFLTGLQIREKPAAGNDLLNERREGHCLKSPAGRLVGDEPGVIIY